MASGGMASCTDEPLLADALQAFRAEAMAEANLSSPRRRQSLSQALDEKISIVPGGPAMPGQSAEVATAAVEASPRWKALNVSFRRNRRFSTSDVDFLKDARDRVNAGSKDAIHEFMSTNNGSSPVSKCCSPQSIARSANAVGANVEQAGVAESARAASFSKPREQADLTANTGSQSFGAKPRQRRSSCDSILMDRSTSVLRGISTFGTVVAMPSSESPRHLLPKTEGERLPPVPPVPLHTHKRVATRIEQVAARTEAREFPRQKSCASIAEEKLRRYSEANGPWKPSNPGAGGSL
jgi:hypothetical protein